MNVGRRPEAKNSKTPDFTTAADTSDRFSSWLTSPWNVNSLNPCRFGAPTLIHSDDVALGAPGSTIVIPASSPASQAKTVTPMNVFERGKDGRPAALFDERIQAPSQLGNVGHVNRRLG